MKLEDVGEALSKELELYVDFDQKYFTDLRSKQVSIEKASLMSITELNKLESTSKASESRARDNNLQCENHVHLTNSLLANLLKLKRRLKSHQVTFDAWMSFGFCGANFIDLVKETVQKYPWYCRLLARYAYRWHMNTAYLLQIWGDTQNAKKHFAHSSSIKFIYLCLTNLNETDRAELETCIKSESLGGVRSLAKKITTSNQYPKELLRHIIWTTTIDTDYAEGNKIALMVKGFIIEIRVAWDEEKLRNTKNDLTFHIVDFALRSSLKSKDPKIVFKTYEQCVSSAADVATKNVCVLALKVIWEDTILLEDLEYLTNIFYDSADNEFFVQLKNVLEPALILINSERIFQDEVNEDLFLKLEDYDTDLIDLNKMSVEQKASLQIKDKELFNRLGLVQKCCDYLEHEGDIEYIRKDFDKSMESFKFSHIAHGFDVVRRVVQELGKDSKIQKCSFDFTRGMLTCSSPDMLEMLIKIQQDRYACKILIDFCKNVIAKQSISYALTDFDAQANAHRSSSSTECELNRLKPSNLSFYQ